MEKRNIALVQFSIHSRGGNYGSLSFNNYFCFSSKLVKGLILLKTPIYRFILLIFLVLHAVLISDTVGFATGVDDQKIQLVKGLQTPQHTLSTELRDWVGDYIYAEHLTDTDEVRFIEVIISKQHNSYFATIKTSDDNDWQNNNKLKAKISGNSDRIAFVFDDYIGEVYDNPNKPFHTGDQLLSFIKTEKGIVTHWGKIKSNKKSHQSDGFYFKMRKNTPGFIGNWFEEIPDTGGNSSFIKVMKISKDSVHLRVYLCRTYDFESEHLKMKNHVVKFLDHVDEFQVSGTIEFKQDAIILNIEKSNLPILSTGKTVFAYKVNPFEPVRIIPKKTALKINLNHGITIDFGRRVFPTVGYFTVLLEQVNQKDSYVMMKSTFKGGKLIIFPDDEQIKRFDEVIKHGKQYSLQITEGELSDDVGNINKEINLKFSVK